MSKNKLFDNARYIVKKLLDEKANVSWPKEIKIAKQLLEFNSDMKFWEECYPRYKPYSLAYFLTDKGGADLRRMKREVEFNFEKPTVEVDISKGKVGEDIPIDSKKPQTVTEFLK